MSILRTIFILVVGCLLVLGSAWVDSSAANIDWKEMIANTMRVIGGSFFLVTLVYWLEQQLHNSLNKGPKVTLITAEERCEALKKAVKEFSSDDLFTTRYSSRSIGEANKSKAYLTALDSRIYSGKSDTYRIVTLDNEKKVQHVKDLITNHWQDNNFAIKVLDPNASIRLIDLVGVDNHFVCLGIETRQPEENYWIRIDDSGIASHFRKYFYESHWTRDEATEIKGLNKLQTEKERDDAIKKIDDLYKRYSQQ
ncbi:hypothetical protein SAMN05421690_102436 [Nitrosomonas sp. Nm51]|uniref:hypothetical protein n=1 Tax=Nitrosomonas sp. Nm51 TaxID=133720 RepID=UPI0008D6F232|nr:hypothetical protein [Nitrosomonas sp. Nm51]SER40675.1 hypothetical protein SAMN05421690_102436 [Nitrosomonas sp. Nm51]